MERDYKQTGQCRLDIAERDFYKTQQGFILSKQSQLTFFFDQKYIMRRMLFMAIV